LRHRQTKGPATDRPSLNHRATPRLYTNLVGTLKRAAWQKKRIERKVDELFEHRFLFVRRRLTPAQRATLGRITRALPQFRILRILMEEVYRLFDRRCRCATALAKLAALLARLRRFVQLCVVLKKLFAPGLEQALVFLDEKLLGATSNAVERGNRR
jgi:hypothetical protein